MNKIYLWYSIILLFPPVHELGHVIIARLTGIQIIGMYWNHVVLASDKNIIYQHLWEYTPLIFLGCILLYLYLYLKENHINTRTYQGVGTI